MIIVFWPRINMALVNAGIIKEDKNVQSNENNQMQIIIKQKILMKNH